MIFLKPNRNTMFVRLCGLKCVFFFLGVVWQLQADEKDLGDWQWFCCERIVRRHCMCVCVLRASHHNVVSLDLSLLCGQFLTLQFQTATEKNRQNVLDLSHPQIKIHNAISNITNYSSNTLHSPHPLFHPHTPPSLLPSSLTWEEGIGWLECWQPIITSEQSRNRRSHAWGLKSSQDCREEQPRCPPPHPHPLLFLDNFQFICGPSFLFRCFPNYQPVLLSLYLSIPSSTSHATQIYFIYF